LYPQQRWNGLFGRWEFARVGILIVVPSLAAFLKYFGKHLSDYGLSNIPEVLFYGFIFVFGISLQVLSLIPLLKYPATVYIPFSDEARNLHYQPSSYQSMISLLADRSICCMILSSWWLAFFQGLTQSVFFTHASQSLGITLEMYIILNSTLYACQTVLCFPSILLMNHFGARKVYFVSLILVSFSLICWFCSTKSTWWLLIIAYILWGFFAPVNISGSTLICKLSRENNQALAFALFRSVAGFFAGLSGIYGGYLLETALKTRTLFGCDLAELAVSGISPFQIIVLISFLGRITAPVWLLWVKEPVVIPHSASSIYISKESPA
jgi:Na+/melibiose symporter-like transporter